MADPQYTVDQLYAKLEKADAAGDTEAAHVIADEIRRMQGTPRADFSNVQGKATTVPRQDGLLRQSAENLFGQGGANALDAAQHHAMSWLHGGAQLVEHGVNAAANAFLPAPQQNLSGLITGKEPDATGLAGVRQYINRTVAADDAAMARRESDYQGRVPDGAPKAIGSLVGDVAPWMAGVGAVRSAGLLPTITDTGLRGLAKKGGALAVEGGLMGALQPVTSGDYATQKGKQIASYAAVAPATTGILGLLGAGARYALPSGRESIAASRLAKLYGDSPEVLAQLRQDTGVPGFHLTPAQALATPQAIQAERALRNNAITAPAFAARESDNNAALRARVSDLAGTDTDLMAAKAARKASTDPYYQQLVGKRVDPARVVAALDRIDNSNLGVNAKVKTAIASLRAELKARTGPDGKIDAGILSGLNENAGSHLAPGATAKEKVALGPVKDSIVEALDAGVPGYRDNLAAYARASQPINDMEAARALRDAIDSSGRDAGGRQVVSLARVRQLLARDDKARFPMSPDAREALESVLEALQKRSVSSNTVAASGPGSAADLTRGLQSNPWAMRVLGLLSGAGAGIAGASFAGLPGYAVGQAVGSLATEGLASANNNIMRRVGTRAADAKMTADAIEAYKYPQRTPQSGLMRLLLPYDTQYPALPPK
jgi:hypothetical protein